MKALSEFYQQCHKNLINGEGENHNNARQYLKQQRGMTRDDVDTHCIGFCSSKHEIPNEIVSFGKELLEDDFKRNLTFRLVDRIILPIFDEFGDAVGLASRKPVKGEPWWNLPAPFYKSNYLFLLNLARGRAFKHNKLYIVEGYMDAITLFSYGLKNAVAIMGTKLSLRQIGLITRYCNNVCICFDVDKNLSGQNARDRAVTMLHKLNFLDNLSVIDSLPTSDDPDSFVRKYGLNSFLELERTLTHKQIFEMCKRTQESRKKS